METITAREHDEEIVKEIIEDAEMEKDFATRYKDEASYHQQIEKEAIAGKRDFWILKNSHNQFSLYPAGHKTAEFIAGNDIEKFKHDRCLKVVPKTQLTNLIKVKEEMHKATKKYYKLLKKIFGEMQK